MRRRHLLSLAAAGLAGCAPGVPQQSAGDEDGTLRRIGFSSCVDQTKPQPIWDTVLADQPQLFIFGGDNVYSSEQPWSLVRLEEAYAQQDAVPNFARLKERVPHLEIWDDHDYGVNDGGAEFGHKYGSKAAFLRFWRAPADDPRRTRDGLYHAQVFGPTGRRVQVILLDTRWFRSPLKLSDERGKPGKERYLPDADPAKTMLGEAQWRWLEEQFRQPAEVRLLVSGIQVVVEGHGWERWGNFPLERERLYRLIAQTRAQGVVILSGDRHVGALYREANGTPYPLYELTSSGITHPWREAAEAGPNRLGPLFTDQHYGTVDIDWQGQSLRLALKNIQGAVQRSQLIRFNELKTSS
jgi:alkaline phosphatase D